MAIEVPQNKEISGGRKNGGRERIGCAIRWGGANGGGAYTLKNDTEEELVRDVDPYIIRVGIERRKRGG